MLALLLSQTAPRPALLTDDALDALTGEVSGTAAKHTVQDISLFHRTRASRQYGQAAQRIYDRAVAYGLREVKIERFVADGKKYYGPQRSRPAWNVEFAELWWGHRRIGSWDTDPISVAQDSASGQADAELVDVGDGTKDSDYAGRSVKGKLVLVARQPADAYSLAVEKYGAAGIVSYAPNQKSAWWKEDERLVRWGHLPTFPAPRTFAFMVSLQQARAWKAMLADGQTVRLRARVRATRTAGHYEVVTAMLPGTQPNLGDIALSCHLDHQRPGANDNASGCAAILEAGRTLAKLIRESRLPRPLRTIRFVWPPEIEGTHAYVNARREQVRRFKAVVHMDMVGGNPSTKAVFHVRRAPRSLPTFVNDVAEDITRFVDAQTYGTVQAWPVKYSLISRHGSKDPLRPLVTEFTLGSDHLVYTDSSLQIPAVFFNDYPDRYIHTHQDAAGRIDATKMRRVAFMGAAIAYALATFESKHVTALWPVVKRHALLRTADMLGRQQQLPSNERANLGRFHHEYERGVIDSFSQFAKIPQDVRKQADRFLEQLPRMLETAAPASPKDNSAIYRRTGRPHGPLFTFGYDYLQDHLQKKKLPSPKLLSFQGLWGSGGDYTYLALCLVDGRRTVKQIRNDLSAVYGPVPLSLVEAYLQTLAQIGLLQQTDGQPR